MSRYDWVVFDADGTLFDFERSQAEALRRTALVFGLEPSNDLLRSFIGISEALWRDLETGAIDVETLKVRRFEQLLNEIGHHEEPRRVSETYLGHLGREARLLPEAETVVTRLGRHLRLVLATNGIADVQRSRLAASPLDGCFEHVVISEEVGHAKPDAAFFIETFRRMGDPPRSRVLVVGDSLASDILGGSSFGTDTCWFNPEGSAVSSPPHPTFTVRRLSELLEITGAP